MTGVQRGSPPASLSADPEFDPPITDPLLRRVAETALKPGESQIVKVSTRLKGQSATGKFVFAMIDYTNGVPESDERYNLAGFGPLP